MIYDCSVGRGAPHILKGILLILSGQWPAPIPTSAKVQIFRGRTIHGLESGIGRRSSIFVSWRFRFAVEKDFTKIILFRNENVLFS